MTAMLIGTMATCQIIYVEGRLWAPLDSGLTPRVQAALRRGVRKVRLDLSRLTSIDAAGVGELVAAFKATKAAGGILDVSHASSRVRRMLEASGVFALLSGGHRASDHGRPPDSAIPIER